MNELTGKVEFASPSQSAKAAQVLLEAARGDAQIEEALKQTTIDISKIRDVIADEADYLATIPSQALSSSNGKYINADTIAKYYADIAAINSKAADAVSVKNLLRNTATLA